MLKAIFLTLKNESIYYNVKICIFQKIVLMPLKNKDDGATNPLQRILTFNQTLLLGKLFRNAPFSFFRLKRASICCINDCHCHKSNICNFMYALSFF